jgi:transposase
LAKHRTHSIEFKRQVAQEFLAGETLHGLAKRRDICRNLIRIWVQKYEAGDFEEDAAAADLLQQYEARIAALERFVGKQTLELEFLKGAVKSAPRPKSATPSALRLNRINTSNADRFPQSGLLRTRSTTCDLCIQRAIWETDFPAIQTPSRVWPRESGNRGKSLAQTRESRANFL